MAYLLNELRGEYTIVDTNEKVTITRKKGGKYYYDHSLTSIEKGNLIEIAQGFTPNGGLTLPSYADNKYKRIIPNLQTNSSKIVDANGEPKVVYHQTNHSVYINRETGQNWDELDWRERMEWDEPWRYGVCGGNNWAILLGKIGLITPNK